MLLDVVRLVPPLESKRVSAQPSGVLASGSGSFSRKLLGHVLALFLTWPRQSNLFLVKAPEKLFGGDEARAAEHAAAKKGKGIRKRQAEAARLRQAVNEKKKFALQDSVFLFPLAPDEVLQAYNLHAWRRTFLTLSFGPKERDALFFFP